MSDAQAQSIGITSFVIIGIISLATIVFAVLIYWRIFSKAGYSGALSLLMFVPIANLVMLCILAFGEWPIYRELNMLRQQVAAMNRPLFPPQSPYPPNQDRPQYPQYSQDPPQYPQDPPYPQNPQYRQG
jgi:ethanolamine transporter EutH